MRIVNFHALAEKILSEIEELTGSPAKPETVVVAIKRFSDKLGTKTAEAVDVLKDSKLSLLGSVTDITILGKSGSTMKIVEDVLKLSQKFSVTPSLFQLPHSVKVLADEDDAEPIKNEAGSRLTVAIRHDHADAKYMLGQFRLSVSAAPVEVLSIPAAIREIVLTAADKRTGGTEVRPESL